MNIGWRTRYIRKLSEDFFYIIRVHPFWAGLFKQSTSDEAVVVGGRVRFSLRYSGQAVFAGITLLFEILNSGEATLVGVQVSFSLRHTNQNQPKCSHALYIPSSTFESVIYEALFFNSWQALPIAIFVHVGSNITKSLKSSPNTTTSSNGASK